MEFENQVHSCLHARNTIKVALGTFWNPNQSKNYFASSSLQVIFVGIQINLTLIRVTVKIKPIRNKLFTGHVVFRIIHIQQLSFYILVIYRQF